ncbi:MAG TPA: SDR family oxidoreductase [Candidatus Dormibacteraeota bacterium]
MLGAGVRPDLDDDFALAAADGPTAAADDLHQRHRRRQNNRVTTSTDPLFDLAGRVAIVTGASSGLGAHFARMLHSRGMRVVMAARRRELVESLAGELGENAVAVTIDLTESGAATALVERAVGAFGKLDLMVNNAGTSATGPAEAETPARFERLLKLNLSAVFECCQAAAGAMLPAGKGSIVNIASVSGFVSLSDRYPMAGYTASKHAVVGLTRELGAQWAPRGIRVNAIAPGFFPTEMTGQLQDQEQVSWIERRTAIGRPGRIDELDAALVFLAADGSSYVVGQTLVVDGGWTIL